MPVFRRPDIHSVVPVGVGNLFGVLELLAVGGSVRFIDHLLRSGGVLFHDVANSRNVTLRKHKERGRIQPTLISLTDHSQNDFLVRRDVSVRTQYAGRENQRRGNSGGLKESATIN